MPSTKWWHSLAISFTVVTWSLAQPLYTLITSNHQYGEGLGTALVLLIVTYNIAPAVALFAADRAILRIWHDGKALHAYRAVLFSLAGAVFIREAQLRYWPGASGLSVIVKGAVLVGLPLVGLAVCILKHRASAMLFTVLAVPSLAMLGVFAYQAHLFGAAWAGPAAPTALSRAGDRNAKAPVFIFIFDALGRHPLSDDGKIDPQRFPHFAALGQDSMVFADATTNYTLTALSIPSLLSGRWAPAAAGSTYSCWGIAPSCPDSILGILSREGYDVSMYDDARFCFEQASDCYDPAFLLKKHPEVLSVEAASWLNDFNVPGFIPRLFPLTSFEHLYTIPIWNEFLGGISAAQSPGRAYYVHIRLPHAPYELDRYGRANSVTPWWQMEQTRSDAQTEQAYEEQVMLADRLLGEFVQKLRDERLYDNSYIVITGDHGSRTLGRRYSHLPAEASDVALSVSLIIHGPGVSPQVSQVEYQHIDLAPTLLDILGLPPRPGLPGVSVFAAQRPTRKKLSWSGGLLTEQERNTYAIAGMPLSLGRWYSYDRASGRWLLIPSFTGPQESASAER